MIQPDPMYRYRPGQKSGQFHMKEQMIPNPHFGSQNTPELWVEHLHREAALGNTSRLSEILSRPVNLNQANRYTAKTALMLAAENDKPEAIRLLHHKGAKLEQQDFDYRTALMLAARKGALKAMEALISLKARLNATDQQGMTALLLAINSNQRLAAQLLLERRAGLEESDYLGRTGLIIAAERGHTGILEDLLTRSPNRYAANFEGMNALMLAAREGHARCVQALIDSQMFLESMNRLEATALQLAAREGHLEIVRMLLTAGANLHHVSLDGETALTLASENGHAQVVKLLLERGAQAGYSMPNGSTALMKAARFGHWKVVRALLEKPELAQMNQADDQQRTALFFASERGDLKSMEALLALPQIELEQATLAGDSALLAATRNGHLAAVKLLLKAKANPGHANASGLTALHIASQKGLLTICRELLQADAPLNCLDAAGNTPLKLAAQKDHIRVMDLLIQGGGDNQQPYTLQFHQFRQYMHDLARQWGLQPQKGISSLFEQLVLKEKEAERAPKASAGAFKPFTLAEQFFMAQGNPLNMLPWQLFHEIAGLFHGPKQSDSDRAGRVIEFMIRNHIDFTEAGKLFALNVQAQTPPQTEPSPEPELPDAMDTEPG